MEPIDHRITAAHLMVCRLDKDAEASIAALLEVRQMPPALATRTRAEIKAFVENGDAVTAAQLIHAAQVRRARVTPAS